jgi:hypothetical protein
MNDYFVCINVMETKTALLSGNNCTEKLNRQAKCWCDRDQHHNPGCSTDDYIQAYFTKYNNKHASRGQVAMKDTNF